MLDNFARTSFISSRPPKSGPLDFRIKNNFPSLFVSEKGLANIYKKAIYYFPISYFCFDTCQNCILPELRLPTVIRKLKFTDFVKRAYQTHCKQKPLSSSGDHAPTECLTQDQSKTLTILNILLAYSKTYKKRTFLPTNS